MKLIICVLIMLISAKECDKNKTQSENDGITKIAANMNESKIQNSTIVNYRASTRGYYLEIWVEGDTIKYTSDYNLKEISTHKIPDDEQESLMALISALDAKVLPELEAPSKAHQFDGAAHATLKVIKDDNTYQTSTFDHLNPPKAIGPIVKKILSIQSMLEKP